MVYFEINSKNIRIEFFYSFVFYMVYRSEVKNKNSSITKLSYKFRNLLLTEINFINKQSKFKSEYPASYNYTLYKGSLKNA